MEQVVLDPLRAVCEIYLETILHLYSLLPISMPWMQVLAIEEIFNHRVTNVVFMGMGEPMLNLKSVLDAHRCLNKVSS